MTTTTEVPGRYPVAIDGVGFLLDDADEVYFSHRSVPVLRPQSDTSDQPGAASLSPEGAWRRGHETWHKGAGQTWLDKGDSDSARFDSSLGVDVWTKGQLSLLKDTDNKRVSANTNLFLVLAQGDVFLSDGQQVYVCTDVTAATPTWTSVVIHDGEAASTVESIATDGAYVYASVGANGIHRYNLLTSVSAHYSDLNTNFVSFVSGRLMAAFGPSLYNVIAAGAAPVALYTHRSPFWNWRGFAEGPTHFYAGGSNNIGLSTIYKITIQPDGTALGAPSVALELPDGETLLNIGSYLNFILIATTEGIRIASIASDGNLTAGRRIPVPTLSSQQYAAFEGQDRYVWFSWPVVVANVSGLGRLDLGTFTDDTLTPAYATDIVTPTLGGTGRAVKSIITNITGRRLFTVSGQGVYMETFARKVASGTLDSGRITYGIPDPKVTTELDVRHLPLAGSYTGWLSTDDAAFASLGTEATAGEADSEAFSTVEARGESFEYRLTLTRDASVTTTGPTITRTTLKAHPAPRRPGRIITLALRLVESEEVDGATTTRDPRALLDALLTIERNGTVVDYQEGDQTRRVLIEEHQWNAAKPTDRSTWWNGTLVVKLREVA